MKKFQEFVTESKEPTKQKSICIFPGRFQGFNKGHQQIIEDLKKQYETIVVFIVSGKKTSEDKERNPFSAELRKEMIETSCKNIQVFVTPNAFLPGNISYLKLRKTDEKIIIASGEDRIDGYKKMKFEYPVEFVQTKRPEGISGTQMRESLKEDSFEDYIKIAAKGLDNKKWFERLKKEINS